MLQEVGETLIELKRVHQLSIELLEQLNVACGFLLENKVEIPNKSTFQSLLRKAWALMDEIKANEPRTLQYSSRRKVTPFRTDEDETEPEFAKEDHQSIRLPENGSTSRFNAGGI